MIIATVYWYDCTLTPPVSPAATGAVGGIAVIRLCSGVSPALRRIYNSSLHTLFESLIDKISERGVKKADLSIDVPYGSGLNKAI